jgi:CheY-like chemotaxis protein
MEKATKSAVVGEQQRILMAEDSPTQAARARLLLEGAGYLVDVVPDGCKGLQRVRESPPDLIISDVVMSEMDGYAFCRAIKTNEQTKRIPFVLLTDRRAPLDIVKGLEWGADNFITKPFEDDILLERIHRIFHHLELRKKDSSLISPDKQQIVELLFSTFEDLSRVDKQLEESQRTVESHARNLEERIEERTQEVSERRGAEDEIRRLNDDLEHRVVVRTVELQRMVNLMAGREVRMAELKGVMGRLRAQLEAAGLTPVVDDSPGVKGKE